MRLHLVLAAAKEALALERAFRVAGGRGRRGVGARRTLGLVVPLQLIASVLSFLARDTVAGTGPGLFGGTWSATALALMTARGRGVQPRARRLPAPRRQQR